MTAHVQRAGASNRTADELSEVFVSDTIDLVRYLVAPVGPKADLYAKADELETDLASLVWAERWLDCEGGNVDQPDILQDLVRDAEYLLGDIGLGVEWDDGYVICDADDWDDDGNLRETD